MADVGLLLFFLFDKDSCVFHPISLSGLLHCIVGVKFSSSFCCCDDVFRCFCLLVFHSLWSDFFGCVHPLLGVDTVLYYVQYCFCQPRCEHCACFCVHNYYTNYDSIDNATSY